jgi:hypothetical protein
MKTLLLFCIILIGCAKKKQVAPTQSTSSTTNQKVWCFYQMDFGNKAFYYCAKTEAEKITKQQECIDNNLNISIEQKTNCNDCQ